MIGDRPPPVAPHRETGQSSDAGITRPKPGAESCLEQQALEAGCQHSAGEDKNSQHQHGTGSVVTLLIVRAHIFLH